MTLTTEIDCMLIHIISVIKGVLNVSILLSPTLNDCVLLTFFCRVGSLTENYKFFKEVLKWEVGNYNEKDCTESEDANEKCCLMMHLWEKKHLSKGNQAKLSYYYRFKKV